MVKDFANSPDKGLRRKIYKRHSSANHITQADITLMYLVWGGNFLLGWNLLQSDEALRIGTLWASKEVVEVHPGDLCWFCWDLDWILWELNEASLPICARSGESCRITSVCLHGLLEMGDAGVPVQLLHWRFLVRAHVPLLCQSRTGHLHQPGPC